MVNVHKARALLAGIVLCAAPAAHAQSPTPATDKFFVNVNFGGQLASRTVGASASDRIYEETATLVSTQPVSRGFLFDVGGGYRVWQDVFVGIVVSRFSNTEDATWSASVPHPLFFNRPATVNGTTTDMKRSEVGIFPHAVWAMPLRDKLDITFALGLSIIKVKQDLVSGFSVATGTQNVTTSTSTEEATGKGAYAAVDFIYNLAPRYGVGGYVRYAGGKADLGTLEGHNVGGMQAGGGIRLRF